MRIRLVLLGLALVHGPALGPSLARAQDDALDLRSIFSNDAFYQEHDLLLAEGDIEFIADAWSLPGVGDSVRVLLGVSLSNRDLQFVRTDAGQWQANYEVTAGLDPEGAGEALERQWDQSVGVGTFDETLLTGETIVFQTELRLVPGSYDLSLTVRDRNADHASRVSGTLEVPAPSPGIDLGEPVLLRLHRPEAEGGDYVVNPSHYYASAPERIEFLAELSGGAGNAGPYRLQARLVPSGDEAPARKDPGWSETITVNSDGTARAFGAIENAEARFGEYALELELVDAGGTVVASEATPLLISGSSGWIIENWDDALSLIEYEATNDEMDILEDIDEPRARIDAWNCFWVMRDPVPATSTNEALQEYFGKIQIANNTWKSALRPGYQSDRGRVFITLGPPDDIAQQPVPGGSEPFEVWTYHRYNFQILFVDRIGFNNYQLESVNTYQRELAVVQRRKRKFLEERAAQCPLLQPAFE